MGNKLKDTDIENCTYYSFDDMISIKDLDLNKIKIDQKSYKNFFYFLHDGSRPKIRTK